MEKEVHIVMVVDFSEGSDYTPFILTIEDSYLEAMSRALSYLKEQAKLWNLNPEKACDFDNLRVADELGQKGCKVQINTAEINVSVKVYV
ncbi:MAG: hypothetical protein ACI4CE_07430 [Methanomethylophilus alvi]